MMKLVFNSYLSLLSSLLLASALMAWHPPRLDLIPQDCPCQEYSKVIKKETKFSPYGTVSLNNKYGKIEVESWDKNRVKVAVKIFVRADSEHQAQQVFDRINLSFAESSGALAVATAIRENNQDWWFWGASENQDDYTIDYKVYVPASAQVDIQNRHGDIYVKQINGKVNISVQHGNVYSSGALKSASLSVEDGHVYIEKVDLLRADLRHAKVILKEAGSLELNSRFSELHLKRAGEVICRTRYDTYKLENVGRFVNDGSYDDIEIEIAGEVDMRSKLSELYIEEVNTSLDLHIDSSSVRTRRIGPSFREVDLSGKFTDFRIGIPNLKQYKVDAVTNYAGIRYPKEMIIVHKNEQGTTYELQGHVGREAAPRVIRARLNYGSLKLEED